MSGIYMITNIVNNKKYIGQSTNVEDRMLHHKSALKHNRHENGHLQSAWNKYGEENFQFEVLEYCEEDLLDELEKEYIKIFNSTDRAHGYNKEDGGSQNKHMSAEAKKKMSDAKKGMYDGEKNPMYGVHLKKTEEQKRKLSERFSGEGNPMYGIHLKQSEENNVKKSEMFSGSGNPFYGKKHSEEARKKISNSKKKNAVRCVETQELFESINCAWKMTNIHSGSISRACKTGGLAGTFHWEYVA